MRSSWFLLLVAACSKGNGSVPAILLDIEGTAEDAYDKALVGDLATVAADADLIDTSWTGFRDRARADGATDAVLSAMDDAVAALTEAAVAGDLPDVAVAREANRVSGPMDELFALYDDPIPASILALDYGGREVSLDAMEVGLDDAVDDIGELDTVWGKVRDEVVSAGGEAEAADYDASLGRQRDLATAGDAIGLLDESDNGLEVVDALEGVFGG